LNADLSGRSRLCHPRYVFAEYMALVKNLRGVVLLEPREDGAEQGDGPTSPFILYLDLADRIAVDGSLRAAITRLPEDEACAALAIVAVVAVP
jgi:hypothetical protein